MASFPFFCFVLIAFCLLFVRLQGYLKALGMARTAEVKRDARIGEAEARADSQIKEAIAEEERLAARLVNDIEIAKAQRDFELKKAAYDQEVQAKVRNIFYSMSNIHSKSRQKIICSSGGPSLRREKKPCLRGSFQFFFLFSLGILFITLFVLKKSYNLRERVSVCILLVYGFCLDFLRVLYFFYFAFIFAFLFNFMGIIYRLWLSFSTARIMAEVVNKNRDRNVRDSTLDSLCCRCCRCSFFFLLCFGFFQNPLLVCFRFDAGNLNWVSITGICFRPSLGY